MVLRKRRIKSYYDHHFDETKAVQSMTYGKNERSGKIATHSLVLFLGKKWRLKTRKEFREMKEVIQIESKVFTIN